MQAAGSAAADTDATVNSSSSSADVDDRDGAGERMERTVPSEQQDNTNNQQQQMSLTPSGVLGEYQRIYGKCVVSVCSGDQRKLCISLPKKIKKKEDDGD